MPRITVSDPRSRPAAEWAGLAFLVATGVGLRLLVVTRFPTIPFWDFLHIVEFGKLLRNGGLLAPGWFWRQLNPGLPVVLSVLFRIPADPAAIARTATAVATGLVGPLPFLLWRRALAYRGRFVAGLLFALWPGQIFFSGVVAQDNWVLLPVVALACLAVRPFLGDGRPQPAIAAVLYVAAVALRQEMAAVLLPLLLAAALARSPARRRNLAILAAVVGTGLSALLLQRYLATGSLRLTTEHSALALYGSFMPGASETGWVDGRAYAAALHPESGEQTFGDRKTLLRMTLDEVRRRPAFHALRIAAWIPRLSLASDADNLGWSLSIAQAQPEALRQRAARLARSWREALLWELALVQGLFLAAVVWSFVRRRPAVLLLAAAVVLKYLVHVLVSPVGRLVVPATALELLAIALFLDGARELPARAKVGVVLFVLAFAVAFHAAVPRLAAYVIASDSRVLPGVERFALRVEGGGTADCRLERGVIMGLGPKWAAFGTALDASPEATAAVSCIVRATDATSGLRLAVRDPEGAYGAVSPRAVGVRVDGSERPPVLMDGTVVKTVDLALDRSRALDLELELPGLPANAHRWIGEGPIQFDLRSLP